MVKDIKDVMMILERCDAKGYNKLKDIIDRNIPIEGFQANLMYLKRGYGKSWISYILVAQKCVDLLSEYKEVTVGSKNSIINPSHYDIDIGDIDMRMKTWLEMFVLFIDKYYKELKINSISSSIYCLTIELKEL